MLPGPPAMSLTLLITPSFGARSWPASLYASISTGCRTRRHAYTQLGRQRVRGLDRLFSLAPNEVAAKPWRVPTIRAAATPEGEDEDQPPLSLRLT